MDVATKDETVAGDDVRGVRERIARLEAINAEMVESLRSVEDMATSGFALCTTADKTCEAFAGRVRDLMMPEVAAVLLPDHETMEFTPALVYPHGMALVVEDELEAQIADGIFGWAISEKKIVTVPALSRPPGQSVIIVPLCSPRRVWGAGLVFVRTPAEGVSQNTLRLLNIVAAQAGLALENVDLQGSLTEQNRNLERLVEERSAEVLERKQQLEKAYAELNEQNAAKDGFLSFIGHELRTPLTSMLSFSEFLCEDDLTPEETKEYAGMIHQEGKRLERLVNDILDLGRLESGRLQYHFQVDGLNDVVALSAQYVGRLAGEKDIQVELDLDESIEPLAFDPERVQQVILNLLSNAIKFSDSGGRVVVTTRDQADDVRVAVRDSGMGVAARDIPKVFNKFDRIEHTGRVARGTGLGMPISKNLIEAGHEGRMWLESEGRGKGTTFFFTLPKAPAQEPEEDAL